MQLTWVEISKKALIHNLQTFRKLIGKDVVLAPCVKANAYGHGLIECARVFERYGADYLCVNALYEAKTLRDAGIKIPILIIGYTPLSDLEDVAKLKDVELIVYNLETLTELRKSTLYHTVQGENRSLKIHLKIETGNHRQGVAMKDIPDFIKAMKHHPNVELKGVSTHFANLEDRVTHQYALYQLKQFNKAIHLLESEGFAPHFRHCANTAATILLPEAYFNFVRVGIGAYGLWPSDKTEMATKRAKIDITLKPALTWKTIVAQIKDVTKGSLIGYGCTYVMPKNGRIAVLPVGYYDGFVRLLSNRGYVLICGKKAPVIGRVCMNMVMADISHIPDVKLEDEVVLIGKQGKETITAEQVAELSHTINYEVTTRINERIPRILK